MAMLGDFARGHVRFWSMNGGKGEWLYVRPHARGLGVSAALMPLSATTCGPLAKLTGV